MPDTMKIKEVDITRPLDQFIAAQTGAIVSKAASDHLMRNELNRKTSLLIDVGVFLQKLSDNEDLMNHIGIDDYQELVDLLGRVRRA